MEKEGLVPETGREMNFFDLCVLCGRAIGRGCAALGRLLGYMLRLTYRYWWIVITLVVLAAAAALYYTREENTIYKANAVAFLNGVSIQQFEQAYAPLRSGRLLPADSRVLQLMAERKVSYFDTYRIVDCLGDSIADYIDFKSKSSPTDTVNVQMQDRICLQFRIKARDLHLLPEVEQEMLSILNNNEALQRAYEVYLQGLKEQVRFNHSQLVKLDSLTTHYYFHGHPGSEPLGTVREGMVFMGDWRVHLFLDGIYSHQTHTDKMDLRMQFATAPVVLENHFTLDPKPVNERKKCLFLFVLMGWIGGCVLAELIDKRKAICAWLKK